MLGVVTPYTTEVKIILNGNFLNGGGYMVLTGQLQRCLHLQPQDLVKQILKVCKILLMEAQYKFIPQNTSFDGDYGNATGPDGTFTGLLLQTGESNAGCQLKICRLLLF
jgi:hypothetical protein